MMRRVLTAMLVATVSAWSASHATPSAPGAVVAAARALALAGARPARLITPMRGVRRERFGAGWIWVIDSGRMADSSLCGTGGCDVQFWRPQGGGVVRIFDRRVRSYAIVGRTGAQPVLRVDYHGAVCGEPGNAECPMDYRWTGGRLIVEPVGGRGRLSGPLAAAVPPDPARIPPVVRMALLDLKRQCRSHGGQSTGVADELPDLDGDGRSEWATGGDDYACTTGDAVIERACSGAPCPVTLFASAGGVVRRAYAATGIRYAVSYAPTGARLFVTRDKDAAPRPVIFARHGGAARVEP